MIAEYQCTNCQFEWSAEIEGGIMPLKHEKVHSSDNNASLASARGSLDRIREKQAAKAAQLEAAQEVSDIGVDDLDARLTKATAGSSVADRIRAKRLGA